MKLLEVLVGGAIVAIGGLGMALMFSEGQTHIVAEGDHRTALGLAQGVIEQQRARGYAVLVPGTTSGPLAAPFARYVATTTVGCVSRDDYTVARVDCAVGDAKEIRVTVTNPTSLKMDTAGVVLRSVLAAR